MYLIYKSEIQRQSSRDFIARFAKCLEKSIPIQAYCLKHAAFQVKILYLVIKGMAYFHVFNHILAHAFQKAFH